MSSAGRARRCAAAAACLLGALAAFAGPAAHAGPFEDAAGAHARGDYATEFKLLEPLAKRGHADAEFNLGVLYQSGRGVPQDYAQALKWFRKAVAQGHAIAKLSLGVMYANGQGVAQDRSEAYRWFSRAARDIPAEDDKNRATAVSYRDRIAKEMTPEELEAARHPRAKPAHP